VNPPPEPPRAGVDTAAALATLRASVQQRRAELAAVGGAGEEFAGRLAELRRREFVQEPEPVSPRPGIGRLLVLVRKVGYHLFFKWHARAVLQQQNEFNQAASSLLAALAEREREARSELGRLRARVATLESRLEGAGSASDAGPEGR